MYAGVGEAGVPGTKGHTTVSLLSLIQPNPGLSMPHRTLMQISAISFFISKRLRLSCLRGTDEADVKNSIIGCQYPITPG